MTVFSINVNMDESCKMCGKGGAVDNGLCMVCINKKIRDGDYDKIIKQKKGVSGIIEGVAEICKTKEGE